MLMVLQKQQEASGLQGLQGGIGQALVQRSQPSGSAFGSASGRASGAAAKAGTGSQFSAYA